MDTITEEYNRRTIFQDINTKEYYINSFIKDKDIDRVKKLLNIMIEK